MAAPSTRITIRLSPLLAARLAAKTGPHGRVADTVRQALEAYLQDETTSRQPVADTADALADTVAAIQARLAAMERRLTALEALAATGSQRQTPGRQAASQGTPQAAAQAAVCPPFGATKHILGTLCVRKHEWGSTGQTLRRVANLSCRQCEVDAQRARRAARRQAPLA